MSEVSTDTNRKYRIIAAIAGHNEPTLAYLSEKTDIPQSSLKRQIGQIKLDFNMDVRFIPSGNSVGRTGHYHIFDWGIIDRHEFMLKHGT